MLVHMIEEARGNLLTADVDALVNTVNTVGVMGKGIALQFKRAYPRMFEDYHRACREGEVEIGRMHVWPTSSLTGPRFIINFPTKLHWRSPSQLEYVREGLQDLVRVIDCERITSVAIPPLGAGNGGLRWTQVRPLIVEALESCADTRVLLFEPAGAPPAREMPRNSPREPLTLGRAALITTLAQYRTTAMQASLVEVQKLMYFLQEAGERLRLNYQPNRYGPYADNLRHVLAALEGSYLTGYGDGSAPVMDAEPLEPLPGAATVAEFLLADEGETRSRIDRVLALVSGFDSMYGLELLATVHWVATREQSTDAQDLVRRVQDWSPRKRELFSARHIEIAHEKLVAEGWVTA